MAELTPSQIWDRAKARLDRMTVQERIDTFKSAGILTKSGNVARPYRGVFVIKKKAKEASE